jgi:hypothetical protein
MKQLGVAMTIKVRAIQVKSVLFDAYAPGPGTTFVEGVKFVLREEGLYSPIFETMVLNADWFRQIHSRKQGMLSHDCNWVFVERIGDLEKWEIRMIMPHSFSVQIIEDDYLEISGSEEIIEIFGQVIFDN